jgi:hypothetical protein
MPATSAIDPARHLANDAAGLDRSLIDRRLVLEFRRVLLEPQPFRALQVAQKFGFGYCNRHGAGHDARQDTMTQVRHISAAAVICLNFACPQPVAAQTMDPANVAFGYTDSTGSMILALNEDNRPITAGRATALVDAVCSEGRVFPIL